MCMKCKKLADSLQIKMLHTDYNSDEYKEELFTKVVIVPLISEGYYYEKKELFSIYIDLQKEILGCLTNATGLTLFSLIRDEGTFKRLIHPLNKYLFNDAVENKSFTPSQELKKFLDSVMFYSNPSRYVREVFDMIRGMPQLWEKMQELGCDHYIDKKLFVEIMRRN